MKHGINRLLYERRKELHFSRREAAIKIDCSRLELYLFEHGYVDVPERYRENIIYKYKLPEDFFDDSSRYPLELDERTKKQKEPSSFSKFLSKLFNAKAFKISSIALTVGFIGMAIAGICCSNNVLTNALSFYDENVLAVRNITLEYGEHGGDIHDSEFVLMMVDKYKSYKSNFTDPRKEVSINYFTHEENAGSAFYKAHFETIFSEVTYNVYFESRILNNQFRTKMTLYEGILKKGYVAADIDSSGNANFFEVKGYNSEGQYGDLEKGTVNYLLNTNLFNVDLQVFKACLEEFFATDARLSQVMSFNDYLTVYSKNVDSYKSYKMMSGSFIIFGAALALLFLALGLVAIFGKNKVYDKIQTENVEFDKIGHAVPKDKPLKKNWKLFPPLPECVVRILAIALLYCASICLYYIFTSALSLDLVHAIDYTVLAAFLSNFTIIGTICIFFLKLDIYQDKKTMFLINYTEFFLGLGYYFLLIIIKYILSTSTTVISNVGVVLLDYVPGNTLWGCVAFNLFIMFLFMRPKNIMNDKKKLRRYRLFAILPLLYLIASSVLSIGKESFGWNIPFEVYSLFFAKSFITVVFAVVFVLLAFLYKEKVYKKYGKENAEIYIRGNKYYYTKNLIACAVILVLGLFEVIAFTVAPNNQYGFGANRWILLAIPLILLYHPHHDKRNIVWDTTMTILYYISLCVGIILIAIVCLQFLINV